MSYSESVRIRSDQSKLEVYDGKVYLSWQFEERRPQCTVVDTVGQPHGSCAGEKIKIISSGYQVLGPTQASDLPQPMIFFKMLCIPLSRDKLYFILYMVFQGGGLDRVELGHNNDDGCSDNETETHRYHQRLGCIRVDTTDPEGAGHAVETMDASSRGLALLSEYIP